MVIPSPSPRPSPVREREPLRAVQLRGIANQDTVRRASLDVAFQGVLSAGEAVSANGQFVAFVSSATDLVSGFSDTNGVSDVFVRDTVNGITTLVSVNNAGTGSGDDASYSPSISADGRFVAFVSNASNI